MLYANLCFTVLECTKIYILTLLVPGYLVLGTIGEPVSDHPGSDPLISTRVYTAVLQSKNVHRLTFLI
jgi:hypothetical protein